MIHQLKKEQQLNCNLDTAWKFFSSPHNLTRITPKEMNFKVLTDDKFETIYEGMVIDYTVSPLFGISMKWKTIISQVVDKVSFTDFQGKGPYKLWNHFHEFIPNKDGVLIKDTVDYELPFGFLGEMMHPIIVEKKLQHIFDYRFKVLEDMFNRKN